MKNKISPISAAVIVTTYNRPDALKVVLQSLLRQSVQPAEIIIADDGSTDETKMLVQEFQSLFAIPVRHCWQEDTGFRLSAIRNKAIVMSTANYILMVDGDMLLHKHFVRDHLRAATVGKFVQGRRVLMSAELSDQILFCKKKCVNPFSKGIKNRLNACCCRVLSPLVSALFSKQKYTSVRGCNMAFWREDVIAVNGFNEAFVGWGREDSEFVVRLFNNGIKRQDLRFGGVAYHLYHQENNRKMLDTNEQLLANTVEQHFKRCDLGINQYL